MPPRAARVLSALHLPPPSPHTHAHAHTHMCTRTHTHAYVHTHTGDKMIFTGSVIVVPDSSGLARAGESTMGGKAGGRGTASELGGVQVTLLYRQNAKTPLTAACCRV